MALCMSDSKSTFVRLSAHPSVHPSVSALKDAPLRGSVIRCGVNHGPIFFFLVDFVCGRERLPAPERHSLPFLAFLSLTPQSSPFLPFQPFCTFLPPSSLLLSFSSHVNAESLSLSLNFTTHRVIFMFYLSGNVFT